MEELLADEAEEDAVGEPEVPQPAAEEAGADVVGADDLAEKVQGGWTDFDVAVTHDVRTDRIEAADVDQAGAVNTCTAFFDISTH